ncbi:MAG: dynamin family protein [Bacteroidota bacterium]
MSTILDKDIVEKREQLAGGVDKLRELTELIGNSELNRTATDLRDQIFEPFLFVIVGEVKAGKSSFINALLGTGEEVAKVAPQPMTDTIQQIVYGPNRTETIVNEHYKKIELPVDILQEVSIVDTPGTNTIVDHHQEITERFVPASDLIVFVFEAKNPYRQSAWDFFNFIHADWRKKVIFVLQQKDLMDEEDLAINIRGVRDHAESKGIHQPRVFAVSAKREIEGELSSGFDELNEFIKAEITGGQAPMLKLANSVETARNINQRIQAGLDIRRKQWVADHAFREEITEGLNLQENQSKRQVDLLVENILLTYDRITRSKQRELRAGLSTFGLLRRSIASTFGSTPKAKVWLQNLADELDTELKQELKNRLNEGVVDLAEAIQQMVKIIDLKLRASPVILREDNELFSQIASRREQVLRELMDQFQRFVQRNENFARAELFDGREDLTPNLAAGSGMAALGVILFAFGSLPVFDITGGVLTAIGVIFAGFGTRGKRRKIVSDFGDEIAQGRDKLGQELDSKLKSYITELRTGIEGNFSKFDQLLEQENNQIETLENLNQEITDTLHFILPQN